MNSPSLRLTLDRVRCMCKCCVRGNGEEETPTEKKQQTSPVIRTPKENVLRCRITRKFWRIKANQNPEDIFEKGSSMGPDAAHLHVTQTSEKTLSQEQGSSAGPGPFMAGRLARHAGLSPTESRDPLPVGSHGCSVEICLCVATQEQNWYRSQECLGEDLFEWTQTLTTSDGFGDRIQE